MKRRQKKKYKKKILTNSKKKESSGHTAYEFGSHTRPNTFWNRTPIALDKSYSNSMNTGYIYKSGRKKFSIVRQLKEDGPKNRLNFASLLLGIDIDIDIHYRRNVDLDEHGFYP